MTEAEWCASTDSNRLLLGLRGIVSERKLRLFACACCRRVWHLISETASRHAVEVAEQFADDPTTSFRTAARAAIQVALENRSSSGAAAAYNTLLFHVNAANTVATNAAKAVGRDAARRAKNIPRRETEKAANATERSAQCDVLRCVVGNPFHRVGIESGWVSWNSATIPRLAQSIYTDRSFDRLPILADALEEAGCMDPDILSHCRGPGPHVRGCWVVDLLLGKE